MNAKYLGVTLGILMLSIVAIVSIASSSGKPKTQTTSAQNKVVKLLDYEHQDASLQVTTLGPIVGDEKRRAIRMTISPEDRGMEILDGYDMTPERSQHYANNQTGYEYFLRAVNGGGFAAKRPALTTDYRGVCPTGNIYIYDLYDASGNKVNETWSTSCSAAIGPFAGNGPYVRQLFQMQLTDYDKFTAGVL